VKRRSYVLAKTLTFFMELVRLCIDAASFSIIIMRTMFSFFQIRNSIHLLYISQKTFSSGTKFVINTLLNNQLQTISVFTDA